MVVSIRAHPRNLWFFMPMRPIRVLLLMLAAAVSGCGSRDDLGTPVQEIPKIPGADKPYQLPPETGPPVEIPPEESHGRHR